MQPQKHKLWDVSKWPVPINSYSTLVLSVLANDLIELKSSKDPPAPHTEPSESAKKSLEMNPASTNPQIQSELAKMLPQNVELDDTMMEHLARAAMELHHQRTGRRIASDNVAATPKLSQTSIVWTEQERTKLENALESGTKNPANIASLLKTRTEAQVKAFLKNSQERQKGSAQMEEEITSEISSPRRQYRGGRGKKPPTQAMNTVPNANLDTKSLLKGKRM